MKLNERGPYYVSQVKPRKKLIIHLPWEPDERVASVGFLLRLIARRFNTSTVSTATVIGVQNTEDTQL